MTLDYLEQLYRPRGLGFQPKSRHISETVRDRAKVTINH